MVFRTVRLGLGISALYVTGGALGANGTAASTLEQELTGGSSRAWRQLSPGPADTNLCLGFPNTLTFDTNYRVLITSCLEGHTVSATFNWLLDVRGPAIKLTIGALGAYTLTNDASGVPPNQRRLSLQSVTAERSTTVLELGSAED